MASSGKKSQVWQHFSINSGDDSKATCLHCTAVISRGGGTTSKQGYTTTNLWNHVKRLHPSELTEICGSVVQDECESGLAPKKIMKLAQPKITDVMEKKVTYDINDPRSVELTKLIGEMICEDMQPFDIVNNNGFRRLMMKTAPRYNIPSRKHFTVTVIPDMYERVKAKLKVLLSRLKNIAITTDLWTCDESSQVNDFISITVHGVDSQSRVHYCLEVIPFDGDSHTAVNIAGNLRHAFEDWGISNQVCVVVTDNAPNMTGAVKDHLKMENNHCLAHSVQLALKDGLLNLRPVRDLLAKSRRTVGHFSHSTTARKILLDAQKKLDEPEHVLIQDVPTCWDSTFHMLQRLVEQRLPITVALTHCTKFVGKLSDDDWLLAEQVVELLGYFEDVTKTVSDEKSSVADAIQLINSLCHMLDMKMSQQGCIKSLATDLKSALTSRFTDTYLISTMLDPRYKHYSFRDSSSVEKVKEYLQKNQQKTTEDISASCSSTGSVVSLPGPSFPQKGIWKMFHKMIADSAVTTQHSGGILEELESYMKAPTLDLQADPIIFWGKNVEHPLLKEEALKRLIIPLGSVSSERLFSSAGNIMQTKRNRMLPENLRMLVFLNKN